MGITHIIRGEDLIAATPRQLLIREALGETGTPVFAHLPLLIDDKRRPLSKRWGDVAVGAYRKQGFLAAAMVNYLALLGWSYDDHTNIFSLQELIDRFSLERVARNPAAFDVNKLEWLNQHYIKNMEPAGLAKEMQVFCLEAGVAAEGDIGRATLTKVAPLVSERIKRLTEAPPMVAFLFGPVTLDDKAVKAVAGNEDYLAEAAGRLESLQTWTASEIEESLRALAEERELKPRKAFQPIRAAVTGTLVSPPLFESMELLGPDQTLERMRST
ncbi:MAG: hypothetical protein LC749_07905 [Actinobacteria bacterium]|nr:hypothetical protein [Actinomycetota bacterium]